MVIKDTNCRLVPYFQVREGYLNRFKSLAKELVAHSSEDPKCLCCGFAFDGSAARCQEEFMDAEGVLTHLGNVGPLMADILEIAEVYRFEVHAPEPELSKLKDAMADLQADFYEVDASIRKTASVVPRIAVV